MARLKDAFMDEIDSETIPSLDERLEVALNVDISRQADSFDDIEDGYPF